LLLPRCQQASIVVGENPDGDVTVTIGLIRDEAPGYIKR